MNVNQIIREGRARLGLSAIEFAKRCSVSRTCVHFWEQDGGLAPNRKRQAIVAEVLGITEAELMLGIPAVPASPGLAPLKSETPMSDSWKVIDRELWRRHLTWSSLGRDISVTDQVMSNWGRRGAIPASRYADIAKFFGWTIEQVMGVSPAPGAMLEQQSGHAELTPEHSVEPVYTQRAHDIASMFDELKDPAVKQMAYTTMKAVLHMAKAGQRHSEDLDSVKGFIEHP